MRDLAARRIRLVEVETPAPSPFGRSLLFRYVGAFMYEGDAPLAERRAQALALDSALLAELLGQADLRELLDPLVVEDTERELQRLSPGRAGRDVEAVADMLRALGPLSPAEVAERRTDPAARRGWLAGAGGAAAGDRGADRRASRAGPRSRTRAGCGTRSACALPPGVPDAFTEPVADPLGDLVPGTPARTARSPRPPWPSGTGSGSPSSPARCTGWPPRAGSPRASSCPSGRAPSGARPGCCGCCAAAAWPSCARRPSRCRRRRLAAFLPAWQNAADSRAGGGASRRQASAAAGPDAVYDVVEQLAGAAVPASALETLVLPGRVPGYSPGAARRADRRRRGGLVRRGRAARRRRLDRAGPGRSRAAAAARRRPRSR